MTGPYDLPKASHDGADEPFLPQEEQSNSRTIAYRNRRLKRANRIYGVLVVILMMTCAGLSIRLLHTNDCEVFEDEIYSPATELIRHKNVVFTAGFGRERTGYQGPPTPERDALWDDLYSFGISRIPKAKAAQLVNKTVPIPGEPGQYVIQLNVFHQLHCLNMLRKRLYSEVDYPPDHELMGIEHLEHCYDALRQSLTCSVDLTPLPWRWVEEMQEAKEVAQVAHTCRDFETVRTWAKKNAVAHFDRKTYVPDDLQE
ncbi:Oxidase ustYa [Paramyrothecium foliicola]|nr:Oxidase ustYa [Paramyrothecium foliicola]